MLVCSQKCKKTSVLYQTPRGCSVRAVHQFKTLIRCRRFTVRAIQTQAALRKVRLRWPKRVIGARRGPWLDFAVGEGLVAVWTTQNPLRHGHSLRRLANIDLRQPKSCTVSALVLYTYNRVRPLRPSCFGFVIGVIAAIILIAEESESLAGAIYLCDR
jgi:hypothetical protein